MIGSTSTSVIFGEKNRFCFFIFSLIFRFCQSVLIWKWNWKFAKKKVSHQRPMQWAHSNQGLNLPFIYFSFLWQYFYKNSKKQNVNHQLYRERKKNYLERGENAFIFPLFLELNRQLANQQTCCNEQWEKANEAQTMPAVKRQKAGHDYEWTSQNERERDWRTYGQTDEKTDRQIMPAVTRQKQAMIMNERVKIKEKETDWQMHKKTDRQIVPAVKRQKQAMIIDYEWTS